MEGEIVISKPMIQVLNLIIYGPDHNIFQTRLNTQ